MLEIAKSMDAQSAGAYGILYLTAVLMPGWRSLVGIGLLFSALIVMAWVYVNRNSVGAPHGDVLGFAFVLGTIMSAGLGLLAGVSTRALCLYLRQVGKPTNTIIVVSIIGFLVIPCLVVGSIWLDI